MVKITRGFRGKDSNRDVQLPPGRHITGDFPVMLAEAAPHIDTATWTFAIDGNAKFTAGLHILDHDEHGFWEQRGYHDRADPWLEQRYQGD